jgi:hypothetical protein
MVRKFESIFENHLEGANMKVLDLNQVAEYLGDATIIQTIDGGFALTHYGVTRNGDKFFLLNDADGNSSVFEF